MPVATALTIKTQLEGGTYPANTLNSDLIFDYEQFEKRRRYPSCEIVTIQPESTEETKDSTFFSVGYEIRYYTKRLGAGTDEISTTKTVEDEIISQIESFVLQDHKIVFESKIWSRKTVQRSRTHPAHIVSILKVSIRQVTPTTAVVDAVLKFSLSGSTVDNPPGADFTYSPVTNVDIQGGFKTIRESVTHSNIPRFFAGDFEGRLICDIPVKAVDLGTTGEKLNQLKELRTVGEKPLVQLIFTDKTGNDPTGSTITETLTIIPDTIQRLYRTRDTVIYRLIATIITPSVITVT